LRQKGGNRKGISSKKATRGRFVKKEGSAENERRKTLSLGSLGKMRAEEAILFIKEE